MIPRIPDWTRTEQGDLLTLTHRDGPRAGMIRYRERVRPLRAFDDLLAETLAAAPGLTDAVVDGAHHFTTAEGEAAAIATVVARADDMPVALALGVVFGDDFYARIAGRATRPSSFAELTRVVHELATRDVLSLGVRRRRLALRGPRGWAAQDAGLATDWIEPTRAEAVLRVFPAEPSRGGSDPIAALIASTESAGGRLDELDGPYDLRAAPGMTATTWRLARRDPQRALRCDLAVLTDDRYEYAVVLESRSAEAQARHRAALHDLVASITPLAVAAPAATADVFAHWTC